MAQQKDKQPTKSVMRDKDKHICSNITNREKLRSDIHTFRDFYRAWNQG